MAEPAKKYAVTQDEIDLAIRGVDLPVENSESTEEDSGAAQLSHLWTVRESGAEVVGLHLRNNQTFVVAVSKNLDIGIKSILKAGYEQPDKLASELSSLAEKMGRGVQYTVTLSGKHAPFLMTKAPGDLNRSLLQKSFKIQMKALIGEEVDDISFIKIPLRNDKNEGSSDYLASMVTPAILDRSVEILKSAKLRLVSWDCDILCYARAASYLWQQNKKHEETRFVVVMGWNRCRLVILGEQGRFVAPVLPLGVVSFLEHLSTTLGEPTVNSGWLDSKKLIISAQDSTEVRTKKILANQAIFTLFVPFAQQVKMHLYKACNDFNISLPKHFTVVGPGAHLFRISDSLELDLGLKALHFKEGLEPEMAAALGAALWDRHDVRLNVLPVTGGEYLERFKDAVALFQEKVAKYLPKVSKPGSAGISLGKFNPVKVFGTGGIILALAIGWPLWQRRAANHELETAKREIASLGPQKEELLRFSEKQTQLEKKLALKKNLEGQRSKVGALIKEVLFNLPPSVRLSSATYRDKRIIIKGVSKTQVDLEGLLELYSKLDYVRDPEPLSIHRMEDKIGFEVQLKLR